MKSEKQREQGRWENRTSQSMDDGQTFLFLPIPVSKENESPRTGSPTMWEAAPGIAGAPLPHSQAKAVGGLGRALSSACCTSWGNDLCITEPT